MKKVIPLTILMVLLIIGSVILFFQNQNLKKDITVLNKKIEDLQKQKPTPIIEKLPLGWKEYRDEEYKFRIWYPEKYTYYNETAEVIAYKLKNDYIIKNNWINEIQIYMPLSSDAPVGLAAIYIYNSTLDIKSFIKADMERLIKNSIFNNVEGYTAVEKLNNMDLYKVGIPDKLLRYYIKKDKNIFIFEGENIVELKGDLLLTFEQMVRSFKFIE